MKPTDFSTHLTQYLTHYLAAQRNLSPNTVRAYRDVFTLLLRFCRDQRGIAIERLKLAHIDSTLVEAFIDHLAKERHVSVATQNQRLAVLHSFFRYIQSEVPELMLQAQRILAIPLQRQPRAHVSYLTKEDLTQLLAQPDIHLAAHFGKRGAGALAAIDDVELFRNLAGIAFGIGVRDIAGDDVHPALRNAQTAQCILKRYVQAHRWVLPN